jgi:hypothetical protein
MNLGSRVNARLHRLFLQQRLEKVELDLWSGDDSSVYFEVYVTPE